MTTRDRFHSIERWPAHTVTTRDRFHCIERWPAHTVTTRDRFHCIERWPAHTVTSWIALIHTTSLNRKSYHNKHSLKTTDNRDSCMGYEGFTLRPFAN